MNTLRFARGEFETPSSFLDWEQQILSGREEGQDKKDREIVKKMLENTWITAIPTTILRLLLRPNKIT